MPAYATELELTLSRQTSTGGRVGSRSTTAPLPFDRDASAASNQLRNAVTTWARVVYEERPEPYVPVDDLDAICAWLLVHDRFDWIRRHPAAAQCADDIGAALAKARAVVDRRPDQWYAGPCDQCGQHLYAEPTDKRIECPCGWSSDTERRRAWLISQAQDVLLAASDCAFALSGLGMAVTPARIWKWAERSRLFSHGVDVHGHPTYRVGDVVQLLTDEAQRQAERDARDTRKSGAA